MALLWHIRRHRLGLLTVSLVLILLLYPYLEGQKFGAILMTLGLNVSVLLAMFGVARVKQRGKTALVLGVPAIVLSWTMLMNGLPILAILTYLIHILLFAFTVVVLLRREMEEQDVNTEEIEGAIAVYLLLGFIWSFAYILLEMLAPGNFSISTAHNIDGILTWSEFLYYSFVTLVTLGYGDITPITSQARSFAILEAVAGMLYLGITIARLVGLYIVRAERREVEREFVVGERK